MSRDPRLFLLDILDAAARVQTYTNGLSQEAFEANHMAHAYFGLDNDTFGRW